MRGFVALFNPKALVNAARWMEIDLENALRQANERFCKRFVFMEELSRQRDISMNGLSIDELETLWQEAKEALKESPFRLIPSQLLLLRVIARKDEA